MYGKKRLAYVDAIKGLAIGLVVLGHVLQIYYSDGALCVRAVYSFHVPLFMFISGYVSWKATGWLTVRKRALQLLVPFFSAIFLGFAIAEWGEWSAGRLAGRMVTVLKQPDMGLWFLWALFFINVIFIACRKMSHMIARSLKISPMATEITTMAAVAIALNLIEIATGVKTCGFHWIAWYFVFFCFGVYWRVFMSSPRPKVEKTLLILVSITFPVAACCFRMHNEPPLFYQWINLGNLFPVAYRMVVGMLGCMFCYLWLKRAECNNLIYKNLSEMGGVTLGIYYFHFYFLHWFEDIGIGLSPHWLVLLGTVTIIAASWVIVCICKRFAATRVLCLGMPWSTSNKANAPKPCKASE